MVYKNFLLRSLISFFILILYTTISIINFELIFYLIVSIYLLIIIEIFLYFKKYKYFIFLYVFLSFIFILFIDFEKNNIIKFNLFILIIISFDIFSYLTGSLFGKTNFLKWASPNKTLEGLIGGILFTILISYIYSYLFKLNIDFYFLTFVLTIILSAFLGDLFESVFKRLNNLKNSSNFVPGHGGFFDRFDSFILSIIFYSNFNGII